MWIGDLGNPLNLYMWSPCETLEHLLKFGSGNEFVHLFLCLGIQFTLKLWKHAKMKTEHRLDESETAIFPLFSGTFYPKLVNNDGQKFVDLWRSTKIHETFPYWSGRSRWKLKLCFKIHFEVFRINDAPFFNSPVTVKEYVFSIGFRNKSVHFTIITFLKCFCDKTLFN